MLYFGRIIVNTEDANIEPIRPPRCPAESVEEQAPGSAGANKMRYISAVDSATVATGDFKIYLLRTSTLQPRGGGFVPGWQGSPSGTVDGGRPEESNPAFAEMATPGTIFRGDWMEKKFHLNPKCGAACAGRTDSIAPRYSRRSTCTPAV